MSIGDDFKRDWFLQMDSGAGSTMEIARIDSSSQKVYDIEYARVFMVKHGTAGGSETVQFRIVQSATTIADSTVRNIADITTAEYYQGWVRFDINARLTLADATYANCQILTTNYSPDASFFLAFKYDYHQPAFAKSVNMQSGCLIEFYGKEVG